MLDMHELHSAKFVLLKCHCEPRFDHAPDKLRGGEAIS